MESESSSIALAERGDLESIPRHPDFRLFAAMNPATDAGMPHPLYQKSTNNLMSTCCSPFSSTSSNVQRFLR